MLRFLAQPEIGITDFWFSTSLGLHVPRNMQTSCYIDPMIKCQLESAGRDGVGGGEGGGAEREREEEGRSGR